MSDEVERLDCGHPVGCMEWDFDREEPQGWCAWCADLEELAEARACFEEVDQENRELRAALAGRQEAGR